MASRILILIPKHKEVPPHHSLPRAQRRLLPSSPEAGRPGRTCVLREPTEGVRGSPAGLKEASCHVARGAGGFEDLRRHPADNQPGSQQGFRSVNEEGSLNPEETTAQPTPGRVLPSKRPLQFQGPRSQPWFTSHFRFTRSIRETRHHASLAQ